jgi:glycosyltransferase involved in cell wall biosynthesis
VLLADGAEAFAEAVIKLLIDTETRRRIEISGRDYVRTNFSWGKSAEVFTDICRKRVDVQQPT